MSRKLTTEQIKERLLAAGSEWIEGVYESRHSRLTLRCLLKGHVEIRPVGSAFTHRCNVCVRENNSLLHSTRWRTGSKTWRQILPIIEANKLKIVEPINLDDRAFSYKEVEVLCFCGKLFTVLPKSLWTQNTRSCGCLATESKKHHGHIVTDKKCKAWAKRGHSLWSIRKSKVIEYIDKLGLKLAEPIEETIYTRYPLKLICFCGRYLETRAADLLRGWCQSCGCLRSKAERTIGDWLSSWNIKFEQNLGGLIKGKHKYFLDFYLPDYKLGIEHNGLWCHGEAFYENNGRIDSRTHCADKHRLMESQGNRLITIMEDEMINKPYAVMEYLKGILGLKPKIGARSCDIIWEHPNAIEFVEKNHIQEAVLGQTVSLLYNNNIVAVLIMVKARKSLGADWEAVRYCVGDVAVMGGFSKLIKAWAKKNPGSIVTYSDNRWSVGHLYEKAGFKKESIVVPRYWYFKRNIVNREHRFKYRKTNLEKWGWLNSDETEWDCMRRHGYDRIWDAGKIRWVLNDHQQRPTQKAQRLPIFLNS